MRMSGLVRLSTLGMFLALLAILVVACSKEPTPTRRTPTPTPTSTSTPTPMVSSKECSLILRGGSAGSCILRPIKPGNLSVLVRPRPSAARWTIFVDGIMRITDGCRFPTTFDPTSTQRRWTAQGEARVMCRVTARQDMQKLSFNVTLPTEINELSVRVTLE